jgi:hypothetical protein
MSREVWEKRRFWSLFGYFYGVCLKDPRKTTMNLVTITGNRSRVEPNILWTRLPTLITEYYIKSSHILTQVYWKFWPPRSPSLTWYCVFWSTIFYYYDSGLLNNIPGLLNHVNFLLLSFLFSARILLFFRSHICQISTASNEYLDSALSPLLQFSTVLIYLSTTGRRPL